MTLLIVFLLIYFGIGAIFSIATAYLAFHYEINTLAIVIAAVCVLLLWPIVALMWLTSTFLGVDDLNQESEL